MLKKDCPFTLNADGLWLCPDCGWVFSKRTEKPPHRNCPAKLTPEQQALYKAFRIEGEDTKFWLKRLKSEFEIAKKEGKDTTVLKQAIAEAEKREAARAEQEKLAAEECEALKPEGEKLGWTFTMVCTYVKALKKWVAAGRPTRTDEEVAAIEAICKSNECKQYEPIEGRCSMCGCKILTPGITIMSKAKLATEKCPKGKW